MVAEPPYVEIRILLFAADRRMTRAFTEASMYVVAIHGRHDESEESVRALADALGMTLYEARQRIIGGGPSVVATLPDPDRADSLAAILARAGFAPLVIDSDNLRKGVGTFSVRRFAMGEESLRIETEGGVSDEIPYGEIRLLLPYTSITEQTETKKVTERKFSVGKTILSGGLSTMKKSERLEEIRTERHERLLRLQACNRAPISLSQNDMSYEGLGPSMKLSQQLNFTYLLSELRRLAPRAVYDDRLASRAAQGRLLGPIRDMTGNTDLAVEILVRTLQH